MIIATAFVLMVMERFQRSYAVRTLYSTSFKQHLVTPNHHSLSHNSKHSNTEPVKARSKDVELRLRDCANSVRYVRGRAQASDFQAFFVQRAP